MILCVSYGCVLEYVVGDRDWNMVDGRSIDDKLFSSAKERDNVNKSLHTLQQRWANMANERMNHMRELKEKFLKLQQDAIKEGINKRNQKENDKISREPNKKQNEQKQAQNEFDDLDLENANSNDNENVSSVHGAAHSADRTTSFAQGELWATKLLSNH